MERQQRIEWAAKHGFGPKDEKRLNAQTLKTDALKQHLPQAVDLLHRIHRAESAPWMKRSSPTKTVQAQLQRVKELRAMQPGEIHLIEAIIRREVGDHPWTPCQATDFELCDPMWDLAYFAVNLEMEQELACLEDLYGVTEEERRRVRAYIPLAIVHCATGAAVCGGPWVRLMERLREVVFVID